jgi:hypothetical protein
MPFSDLTAKQYEAIGRLMIAFNNLEMHIEVLFAHTLGAPEWSVSLLFAEEELFGKKVERFKKVLRAISEDRPGFGEKIESLIS